MSAAHAAPVPHHVVADDVEYEGLPELALFGAHMVAGAFAGIAEHAGMYPVDLLKTRVQAAALTSNGGLVGFFDIVRREGFALLWRGLSLMVLGAGPAHAVYFGVYEVTKALLVPAARAHEHNPVEVGVAGVAATVLLEFLMNPFDVVKQRMQLQTGGAKRLLAATIAAVYRQEGVTGFYLLYPTTLAMTIPFTVLNFTVYDLCVKVMNPTLAYNPLVHCVGGGIAGAVAAAVTTPLDCVKTLLQVRGELADPRVREASSLWRAAKVLYAIDGWRGFWRGLQPRVVSNMPATALCWTSYEMGKYVLGASDGVAM